MNTPISLNRTVDLDDKTLSAREATSSETPQQIGRYRILESLGDGGFGLVYLAEDEQLGRKVAVKVPHAKLVNHRSEAEAYLNEARMVAGLDHTNIVPVYDVGQTPEYPCYIVSKYVKGTDLSTLIKEKKHPYEVGAQWVATVADALHYAHKKGLVHRDVKPGNILIDEDNQPFVVDFGLALTEQDLGKGPRYAGTPSYMSPEQARGEGHRVDGRSDIFSLGIVLYELVTGRKPFRGATNQDLLEQVIRFEPKPIRQYDETLPKELERICQKAIAKRASERYLSAHDMAEDLRHFLLDLTRAEVHPHGVEETARSSDSQRQEQDDSTQPTQPSPRNLDSSASQSVQVIPKGLRAFDSHDSDFFLELIPGARDREGLPESLRFWKTRIAETERENTFSMGLIYGPSGCGKSSFVRAGLIPRLPAHVQPIYVEATPADTESRLTHAIRKRCTDLPESVSLPNLLKTIRRGKGLPQGQKLLIILDQFEQWLHAHRDTETTELVEALRQCDGTRVQCVLMVRDDFWMAVTRFLRELEVRLVENQNIAAVDLFPERHAKKVLAAFGRAFGSLPQNPNKTTKEQKEFIQQSVSGLSEEGKVICVRLALFAEMMKGKPWTPTSLQEVGGTEGVGVSFLDGTFSSSTASPEHRLHQKAARAVLQSLLPDAGMDIKGTMRPEGELLEASGYKSRPEEFDELIRILDNEIRLITPTDPSGYSFESETPDPSLTQNHDADQKYFQLTHDYMVHSLRVWLTRKQKETRKGRAELQLADSSSNWNSRKENRYLPSFLEHLSIRFLTDHHVWTAPQRKMMDTANHYYQLRAAIVFMVIGLMTIMGLGARHSVVQQRRDAEASGLVDKLFTAETSQIELILSQLDEYPTETSEALKTAYTNAPNQSNAKLHAALALLPLDPEVSPFISDRLLTVSDEQFPTIRDQLAPYKDSTVNAYWKIAQDPTQKPELRFRAACTLASYSPESAAWKDVKLNQFVAEQLVAVNPSELSTWRDALRPVKSHLITPLTNIFLDEHQGQQRRNFATELLVAYQIDDYNALFDLLANSDLGQFKQLYRALVPFGERTLLLGRKEMEKSPKSDATHEELEHFATRQANTAAMLFRLGATEQVWPKLRHSADNRVRSYLIHWLSPQGADYQSLLDRYLIEEEVSVKRALLLCLGEFDIPTSEQLKWTEQLSLDYQNHPDAGVHAAAEWLLRRWGQDEVISRIQSNLGSTVGYPRQTEPTEQNWFVNGQLQTYAVFDAGTFKMGSPLTEDGRYDMEMQHLRKVERTVAMATHEVTREQWRKFYADCPGVIDPEAPTLAFLSEDAPMKAIKWYEAAHYCNWLSEQEGIPKEQWCYEPNDKGKYGRGMRLKENWVQLTGYRLPTEGEWEYACRANSATARFFGESDSLLDQYAWYQVNSEARSHPVARLKPNDFGLFDMLGNVSEWCTCKYLHYDHYSPGEELLPTDKPAVPLQDPMVNDAELVTDDALRVGRGPGYSSHQSGVRAADRTLLRPLDRRSSMGFRTCRTIR